MRLAVVVNFFPGLSMTFVVDQILGLLQAGHDVQIFAREPRDAGPMQPQVADNRLLDRTHHWFRGAPTILDVMRNTVSLLSREPASTLGAMVRSFRLRYGWAGPSGYLWALSSTALSQGGFDAVLCHFGENAIKVQRLREIGAFKAPMATFFHGYDLTRFVEQEGRGVYASLFRRGELMLPVSEYFRRRLEALGCPGNKIRVHRMGIDLAAFDFRARRLAEGDSPRILSVCRLVEKKGIDYALRSLSELARRGHRFSYHVVGDGPEGGRLRALARSLGIANRVTFHGAQSHRGVAELQASCHLFLLPSVTARDGDQEGIPVSIMEAMAAGMPVVSTRHSGIPELIEDGVSGHLAAEHDVEGLASALSRFLSAPETWEDIAKRARRVVEDKHDREKLNRELSGLLEEMVAKARAADA